MTLSDALPNSLLEQGDEFFPGGSRKFFRCLDESDHSCLLECVLGECGVLGTNLIDDGEDMFLAERAAERREQAIAIRRLVAGEEFGVAEEILHPPDF